MKQKLLLEVLLESEMAIDLLLFLKDGAKQMDTILTFFDTDEQVLLPQAGILKDYYLIIDAADNMYALTTIGKAIVDKMAPLLDILDKVEDIENTKC
jgi:predicted transcriptional regulator